MKLVLHELHIDGAPESIALAEANVSLALRAPVRPGHMCLFYHRHGRGSTLNGLLISQPLQSSPASKPHTSCSSYLD